MTTKTLKERSTGRTKNIAMECAKTAMNSPNTEVWCWDHDAQNQDQHLYVASLVSGILAALSIPHTLHNNCVKVIR